MTSSPRYLDACVVLAFRRLFSGLSINSTVYLNRIFVTLSPYDPLRDLLSVGSQVQVDARSGEFRLDKDSNIDIVARPVVAMKLNGETAGVMELVSPAGLKEKTASDWDRILNSPVYKLNLDVSRITKGLISSLCTDR